MTIATLGLAVQSGQVSQATPELQKLTAAAGQAEAAATRLAGASNVEAAAHGKASAAAHMHTAALQANNRAMAMANSQRANLIFQLNDIGVSLASGMNPLLVAVQQGSQIATIYGPGQGGIGKALAETGNMAVGAATKFAPLGAAIGAVTLLLYGLTRQINETNGANVSMVDTALAIWQSMAGAVQSALGPAFTWLADEFNRAVDQITADSAREVNTIIGLWAGSADAITAVWGQIPDALGFITYEASREVVNGIVYMVSSVQSEINMMMSAFDTAVVKLGGKAFLPRFDLQQTQSSYITGANPYESAGGAVGAAGDAFGAAMGKDYVGDWMRGIGKSAQDIARARAETEDLGKAASAANDNFGKLVDQGLGGLTHWTESFGKAAQSAFSNLGSGIIDAFEKGGDVAANVLNMLMDKVGQFGETLMNNGLNGLLNAGLGALGGMFGGGSWGVAGGFSGFPGIFGIPGMAAGGTVGRGGMSWVGEQGPELLRLPAGAQVIPNGPSMAMAANSNGGGDIYITNQINVPAGTSADVAPAIAREVTKELRRQLPDAIQAHNRNPLRRAG